MKKLSFFFLINAALVFQCISQENLRFVQLETGSFKIFSDRGNISGWNIRFGAGNILDEIFEIGFEVYYQKASSFDDELLILYGNLFGKSEEFHGSGGVTGFGRIDILPFFAANKSVYKLNLEAGVGTMISNFEILKTQFMGGVSVSHEIDKGLQFYIAMRVFLLQSDKILDDVKVPTTPQVKGVKDRYRTINAGFKIIF